MDDIPIDNPKEDFCRHLDLEDNNRIIFSGAFGSGKTYFLNKFFAIENEKYLQVRIAPTNYSISSNDDIFDLIKYDILTELIPKRYNNLDETELTSSAKIFMALNEVGNQVINIVKYIPKLNKPLKVIESFQKGIDSIAKKVANIKIKDSDDLKDFGNSVENHSLIKSNAISQIIKKLLYTTNGQKSVLVIDDLDRIDPDHIFRILNIFSAHIDLNEEENKFGFDIIILVCDIHNIRNIFHAKFGDSTDFSGYVDKFYTYNTFEFDNRQMLEGFVVGFLQSISINMDKNLEPLDKDFFADDKFTYLIMLFIRSNALTIRKIKSKFASEYTLKSQPSGIIVRFGPIKNWQIRGYIILQYLIWIFGGNNYLEQAILKTIPYDSYMNPTLRYDNVSSKESIIAYLLLILDSKNHNFIENPVEEPNQFEYGQYSVKYNLKIYGRVPVYYAEFTRDDDVNDIFVQNVNLMELMRDALKSYMT